MKKTFTINISGTVFHIEEDAYTALQQYLINLKNHFGNDDEGKEIIADIEARIAEIFSSKSDDDKKVITIDWVNEVMETMGTPQDFAEEEGEESSSAENQSTRKRRLYRNPEHRVLGGVCSGLGAYFNMDTAILRIILALLFFFTSGTFGLAYIILWIAVPKAINTAQRLEMRGQEATVKNIEKTIREEVDEVKKSYQKFKESDSFSKGKKSMEDVGNMTYSTFKIILKVFVVLFGAFLILSGFVGILGLITSLFIGYSIVDVPFLWIPELHIPGVISQLIQPGVMNWGVLFVGLIVGIPLLAMLFIGTKIVFRYKSNNTAIALSIVGLWLVSLFALIILSVGEVGNFKKSSSVTNNQPVVCDSCQTLYLRLENDKYDDYAEVDWDIDEIKAIIINGEEVIVGSPQLNIERSSTNDFVISVKNSSRGKTNEDARANCQEMVYNISQQDSTVLFDPYFFIGDDVKWRNQEVDITVRIPEGKTIFIGENMSQIIHDIENVSNTWEGDMVGKYWEMKPKGLTEIMKE